MQLIETISLPFNVDETNIDIEVYKANMMDVINSFSDKNFLDNKPGVYCYYEKDKIYIGESTHPFRRLKEHITASRLNSKHQILVFRSNKFNKSAVYNIETKLIDYFYAEDNYKLLNQKISQGNHEYFLKELYEKTIDTIWEYLLKEGLSKYEIQDIEKMEIFKFSPYKDLNSDQTNAVEEIKADKETKMFLIKGYPGTGKSIVASTLFNTFAKEESVALISGTPAIEHSFKNIFKRLKKDFKTDSIIGRAKDVINEDKIYDLIIVDEAHRLLRKGGKGMGAKYMHLNKGENDLDELRKKAKRIIILYDENQNVHDGDFFFDESKYKFSKTLYLREQMRASTGYRFINYMIDTLNGENVKYEKSDYDAKVFSNFKDMYDALKEKSKKYELTRMLSGYTREWVSKDGKWDKNKEQPYDFDIDGVKLRWNSSHIGWINSDNARNLSEVAYYDTIQGFDLQYAGVIIGKDLYLDDKGEIQVSMDYIFNHTQAPAMSDPHRVEKFKKWTINRYKILLSRGSKGAYIYAEDPKLAKKLISEINK